MNNDKNMVPDLQASLLCDDVRQERNGKFILIGIFDGLALPSFPATFPRLCIANRWCCGEGEFEQRTRLVTSDGNVFVEGRPVKMVLPDENKVSTTIEFFVNLKIPAPGDYWVEVLLDRQLRLRYPLHVQKRRTSPHEPT